MINLGSILPVGTIIHSMLTTTQFSAEYGDNWVLADGRSVAGTKYASVTGSSTIPDMRGTFLRCKDNGSTRNADGDLALGTYTDDKFETHTHTIISVVGTSSGFIGHRYENVDSSQGNIPTNSTGGNETSPKSIIVNFFIRIN